ncbi:TetR/AcrR family transcriptional regulator [Kitasatospora kifunensis]|uniref:AcrR family transcriptional regulator n=1 Tax=Kitasatospora kifunensis TaxID=58351 RepID=A0A7W7R9S5_KITKI|nr:TetR/AcrR family transcriptional regulator [Kitasatospora kifunensis]MBB4927401.1 AcrR family transcriptional regulator [Kitasatospora kifunensis]
MPVKAGTTLDPQATRRRVLDSAVQLFYERGVHAVGVDEIAQHAGASKLTIYRNFGSKEGLVEAALRDRSERVHRWLATELEQIPAGRERVMALFDLLTRWYTEQGYLGCAIVNTAVETRHLNGVVRELPRAHLMRYRELLEGLLSEAGIAEPAALARHMLLLIEGATMITAIDGEAAAGHDARAAAEVLFDAARRNAQRDAQWDAETD